MQQTQCNLDPAHPRVEFHRTKRNADIRRIEKLVTDGYGEHAYDFHEWREWTGNNYIKSLYDVMLADGTVLYCLYPNAGTLYQKNTVIESAMKVKVRLSLDYQAP